MIFTETLQHTLQFEGGYANDPDDRGGETFRGISRKNWPDWAGWKLIDQAKARGLKSRQAIDDFFAQSAEMEALVAGFYYGNFWQPFERLALPPLTAAKLFDASVNLGLARAVKLLQKALNSLGADLAVDGAGGPQTLAAAQKIFARPEAEAIFLARFAERQGDFYRAIAAKNPALAKFLKGWLRRAAWVPQ
jgi:type VI secretion system secreted protein VgrG